MSACAILQAHELVVASDLTTSFPDAEALIELQHDAMMYIEVRSAKCNRSVVHVSLAKISEEIC